MTQTNQKMTVYYDGACPLCSFEIAHYKRQAGADKLAFVDASEADTDLGDGLSRSQALGRFHVRDTDGTLILGAAGFARIWGALPRWRIAARLATFPGVLPVLELAYRAFLPIRPVLARVLGRRLAKAASEQTR
ncbi:thiol-disulfide oxidoreductase DCC family protein [Roseovarius sp. 2305UL8-3]|uniref:thiol-disulfide oxidoreductase DCC family protein n=1 Tax=Roseovarius conchicola TaxID=3121636 RepID=UPI003528E438